MTNNGITPATAVRIAGTAADASVKVSAPARLATIPPGGAVPLTFRLRRVSEGTGQDVNVRFVVTYEQSPEGASDPNRVAVASLTVKAAVSPVLVEATFESKVETINENRPGEAALVIRNPREAEVQIDALEVTAPSAVSVTLTCPAGGERTVSGGETVTVRDCPFPVAARSQETLRATFQPADAVAPGPRIVLVKIEASSGEAGSASVVATTSFLVDIFAESDILKAIGVPVFLLLPGVLVVVISWFLISKLSPWRRVATGVSLGDVVSAATVTAILGLLVSLLIAAAYPWLTQTFPPRVERDYLRAYGFQDFYYVLGYSFALAVAVWIFACIAGLVLVPLSRWLFVPGTADQPGGLLRKMGLRGVFGGNTIFPRVNVAWAEPTITDPQRTALALRDRPVKVSVVPGIVVNLTNAPAGLALTIEAHVTDGHAFRLWWTVRRAVRGSAASLSYRPGAIDRPELVDRSRLTFLGQEGMIVEVRPED